MVGSFAFNELSNKHFIATSEVEKVKRARNSHQWPLRDLAETDVFKYTFLLQFIVLDTVTEPQLKFILCF